MRNKRGLRNLCFFTLCHETLLDSGQEVMKIDAFNPSILMQYSVIQAMCVLEMKTMQQQCIHR